MDRNRITGEAQTGDAIAAHGKPVGNLLSRAGDQALAYLRFDRAHEAMTCGSAQVVWDKSEKE